MLWVGGCMDDKDYKARDLIGQGMVVYRDATPCTRAIRAAYDFGQFVRARKSGALTPERPANVRYAEAAERFRNLGAKITEREAKELLACYGLPVTQEALAETSTQAVALAGKIGGKVVLKIDSPDIAHKTEAGGVRIGVEGAEAVTEA